MMSNAVIAGIRTAVQYGVSLAVAAFAAFVLDRLGVEIDAVAVTEAAFLVVLAAVVWALNSLSARFPLIARILSLGASPASPTYEG